MAETITASKPNTLPITVVGKQLLEDEVKRLLSVERPSVVRAIEEARAQGDLSENAEYSAAKERQSFIEGRIQYINGVLAAAEVIDPSRLRYEHIVFGATVEVMDAESEVKTKYQIVGVDEADIKKGKLSIQAPLARALIGKRPGDEISVKTPRGDTSYEILSVQY